MAATDVCTPQEASSKLHLIAIRDRLTRGMIRSLSWTDTRDMVADPLTKGGVDRTLLTQVMDGQLTIKNELKTQWGRRPPTPETVSTVWQLSVEDDSATRLPDSRGISTAAPVRFSPSVADGQKLASVVTLEAAEDDSDSEWSIDDLELERIEDLELDVLGRWRCLVWLAILTSM